MHLFHLYRPITCFISQAVYLVDCMTDKTKGNKILNVGGPDDGLTMTAQGKLVSWTAKKNAAKTNPWQ